MAYSFINADTIANTIQFDVLDADTRETIEVSNVKTQPSFDMIQFPSGLGYKQTLDVVSGDTLDYVLKQTFDKKNIKMNVLFRGSNAYLKMLAFNSWFSLYANHDKYIIRFSYQVTGSERRYVDVIAINGEPKERSGRFVTEELTLQPISPFYEETAVEIIYNTNNDGMIYPYTYPYYYGGGSYSENNTINNGYIKDIPLKLTLKGPIDSTPSIQIYKIDENGDVAKDPYSEVSFTGISSLSAYETLVIDAFTQQIYLINTSTGVELKTDVFNNVDKSSQAFLYAEPGNSRIVASLDTDDSVLEIYYVRYVL